jgi:hypothetical protein
MTPDIDRDNEGCPERAVPPAPLVTSIMIVATLIMISSDSSYEPRVLTGVLSAYGARFVGRVARSGRAAQERPRNA